MRRQLELQLCTTRNTLDPDTRDSARRKSKQSEPDTVPTTTNEVSDEELALRAGTARPAHAGGSLIADFDHDETPDVDAINWDHEEAGSRYRPQKHAVPNGPSGYFQMRRAFRTQLPKTESCNAIHATRHPISQIRSHGSTDGVSCVRKTLLLGKVHG